ncbi:MAG: winged helix-turn-helix transcriptional regulator, partial [Clostridia bacterium]|nr:winged helix-turn-helix transcriptional regulator [Clostridia bacterium]
YIEKAKDETDERNLVISPTPAGKRLRDAALPVPECIAREFCLTPEEAAQLYRILYKMLDEDRENGSR